MPCRLPLLLAWVMGALGAMFVESSCAGAERPPNLIVIMADDLSAGELGCYGNQEHQTPHLDALARTGVKFETCFTAPVCHPTRFMIMTGQYGCHNGVYNFPGKRGGPEPGAPEEQIINHRTFAQMLKPLGYATAVAGKWQLSGSPPDLVYECGFDEYCLWGYGGYYSPEDRARAERAGIDFRSRYWHPSVIRNGTWVPTTDEDYGPDIYNAFARDFIQRHREQPFFLYYPMCLTHGPWLSTPETTKGPADKLEKARQNFGANVEYMDQLVGRLVDELDRQGLREETIVFFTGDNGTGQGDKSTPTERGARVPMIVNGPGRVEVRGSTLALTDLSDIVPTLVELAGGTLPDDRPIDGHSYARFLAGETDTTREWIFAFQADRRILRTERWLLEDNSPLHYGHLFDCGTSRDGTGYVEVTDSTDPKVLEARAFFDRLLAELPAPVLDHEGPPNENKRAAERDGRTPRRARQQPSTD